MNPAQSIRQYGIFLILAHCFWVTPALSRASSGTEGAAFLDIPTGAGPAALGAAYTALAQDAYAPTWNPGGLGFLKSPQFSGQHLSYLDSLHYEYLSFAVPFSSGACSDSKKKCTDSAIGGSVQYLGTGDIDATDIDGNPIGSASGSYASYNLAYGRRFGNRLSLGLTGKFIHAKLADHSGSAFAADLGSMYQPDKHWTMAATLTNLGSKLQFIDEADSLPTAFHLGASYQPAKPWLLTSEVVYRTTGLASWHMGGEWRPLEMFALRTGYRTDTLKGLSPLAGVSAGFGLTFRKQEFAYAWVPYDDLGSTHYFSLLMRFGEKEDARKNLIQYQSPRPRQAVRHEGELNPEDLQLMELLREDKQPVAKQKTKSDQTLK